VNLLRVYPKGTRLLSSNYDPMVGWTHGAQMVAFNMQVRLLIYIGCQIWTFSCLFKSSHLLHKIWPLLALCTCLLSSNNNPMVGWTHGAQMVAFNMQVRLLIYIGCQIWAFSCLFKSSHLLHKIWPLLALCTIYIQGCIFECVFISNFTTLPIYVLIQTENSKSMQWSTLWD